MSKNCTRSIIRFVVFFTCLVGGSIINPAFRFTFSVFLFMFVTLTLFSLFVFIYDIHLITVNLHV
ncbi:hypothetical protein Hanom_Chr12g01149311 [Helianthus anomalus]